jgi:hypothetical protein
LIGDQKKSDPQGYFHVVSKDKGFDALIEHRRYFCAARKATRSRNSSTESSASSPSGISE